MTKEDGSLGAAMMSGGSSYSGVELVLLTRHGKERVTPVLEDALGCRIRHESGYDTDRIGTFTREVPHPGTQPEAARNKARIGMGLTGLPRGLLSWNVEQIVFIDAERGLEIVGMHQGKACFEHLLCGDWAAVESFARGVSFPEQQLVMRPDGQDDPRMCKGIASWPALKGAYAWARNQSAGGQVFVETDGRAHAHANPTPTPTPRQPHPHTNIRLAAQNLAHKMRSRCLACELPTRQICAEIWGCLKCGYRESRPVVGPIRVAPDPL